MREVFISYKDNNLELGNIDATVAFELCDELEKAGISCWIAPRDIEGGDNYGVAIENAINNCKVIVLVFSQFADASEHVANEIDAGVDCKVVIIPFNIDGSTPRNLKYYLRRKQWIDASSGYREKIPELIHTLRRKLNKTETSENVTIGKSGVYNVNESYIDVTTVGKSESHSEVSHINLTETVGRTETDLSEAGKHDDKSLVKTFNINGVSFNMVRVDGGSFMMGAGRTSDSEPAHEEMVSSFYIGDKQVTCSLWHKVFGSTILDLENLWKLSNDQSGLPKVNVSWHDCQLFVKRLNELTEVKETGFEFCLPTEVQWEFAARGGKKSRGYQYAGSDYIQEVAWYALPQSNPKPVGQKKPNELGLYDMSGNVWEWCQDECYYYPEELFFTHVLTKDLEHAGRVYRGGSFRSNHEKDLKVTSRNVCKPDVTRNDLGLRLVLRAVE